MSSLNRRASNVNEADQGRLLIEQAIYGIGTEKDNGKKV